MKTRDRALREWLVEKTGENININFGSGYSRDWKFGGHKRRVNTRWNNKSDKDKERRQFLPVICLSV